MADPVRLIHENTDAQLELPRNIEAEAALLGAIMIDNRIAEDVQLKLRAEHFFEPVHGRIYDAIMKLIDRSMVANPVTLKPMFESDEATRALDTSDAVLPTEQIEHAEMALYRVAEQGGETGSVKSFVQATTEAVRLAEKAMNAGGGLSGVTTGLDGINAKTGGLHHSDLLILAGRPGMGKTALATNIAFNAAARWMRDMEDGIAPEKSVGAPVAFFSLEMSADQLATRILSEQSRIVAEEIRTGKMNAEKFRDFARSARELESLPLYIDDTPGLTIAALRTRARRMKRRHQIGLIIVDYLQLLQGSGRGGDGNRVQEISEISRGLKTLAKELNVPVMALSQLSRAVEQREDKKPQLSDLRESGSIEQDADIVLFVYREEYYVRGLEPKRPVETDSSDVFDKHNEWLRKLQTVENLAEVIVAKQRHGATGTVPVRFEGKFTRFSDYVADSYLPTQMG